MVMVEEKLAKGRGKKKEGRNKLSDRVGRKGGRLEGGDKQKKSNSFGSLT